MILSLRAGLVTYFLLCTYLACAIPVPLRRSLPVALQPDDPSKLPYYAYPYSGAARQTIDNSLSPLVKHHARESVYWDDPPILVRRKKGKEPATQKVAIPAKSSGKPSQSPPVQSSKQEAPPKIHKSLGERMHELHEKVKAVGQKIKVGFQKFGHFLKTVGAKIVKVGLKIWSTVTKIASKVVGFIPVIGKPLGRLMDAGAEVANKVSDKIKAHIGGKLGTAMDRMSKAQKIVGYIP